MYSNNPPSLTPHFNDFMCREFIARIMEGEMITVRFMGGVERPNTPEDQPFLTVNVYLKKPSTVHEVVSTHPCWKDTPENAVGFVAYRSNYELKFVWMYMRSQSSEGQ
jgi:hypothetical protein